MVPFESSWPLAADGLKGKGRSDHSQGLKYMISHIIMMPIIGPQSEVYRNAPDSVYVTGQFDYHCL